MLHAASAAVTPMPQQSWRAGSRLGLQPEQDNTGFPSVYRRLGPLSAAQIRGFMCTVWGCDIRLEAGQASEGLAHLVSGSVAKKKSLQASYGNVTHKCVITC